MHADMQDRDTRDDNVQDDDAQSIEWTERGEGPPLLLVHGFPLDRTMWADQLDPLSVGRRVVVPDLPGFGASPTRREVLGMDALADDLARFLDRLEIGEPVVFCGLSMGGYVAWQFWTRHAERLAGLVLCDTRAIADTPDATTARLAMAEAVLREGPQPVADAMLPKLFAPASRETIPKTVARIERVILTTDPRTLAAAQRGMAARPDMTARLPEIDVPTLVVVGEHDAIAPPAEAEAFAGAMPRAELAVISDAGHMAPLENPAAVNRAAARFLENL